jgi:hypothetical protein
VVREEVEGGRTMRRDGQGVDEDLQVVIRWFRYLVKLLVFPYLKCSLEFWVVA